MRSHGLFSFICVTAFLFGPLSANAFIDRWAILNAARDTVRTGQSQFIQNGRTTPACEDLHALQQDSLRNTFLWFCIDRGDLSGEIPGTSHAPRRGEWLPGMGDSADAYRTFARELGEALTPPSRLTTALVMGGSSVLGGGLLYGVFHERAGYLAAAAGATAALWGAVRNGLGVGTITPQNVDVVIHALADVIACARHGSQALAPGRVQGESFRQSIEWRLRHPPRVQELPRREFGRYLLRNIRSDLRGLERGMEPSPGSSRFPPEWRCQPLYEVWRTERRRFLSTEQARGVRTQRSALPDLAIGVPIGRDVQPVPQTTPSGSSAGVGAAVAGAIVNSAIRATGPAGAVLGPVLAH